jgi:triphosphoribosyl-dephospho-CoA synthase
MIPTGLCAQLACIWEATARKPGNVHRHCDFTDLTYLDFLTSAAAIAPEMELAPTRHVGETVLAAVRATRLVTATNTNLGIVLLIAPLAAVPAGQPLRPGLHGVLDRLDVEDSRLVYEAIRLAHPAGLGEVADQDVRDEPTLPLREIMALAAERDLIARQYVNGFELVFDKAVPRLCAALGQGHGLEQAIITCHLDLLARHRDSLILRKRGPEVADEVTRRARQILDTGRGVEEFDAWLREDGHARNPGTTADLVAAALFVALREGHIRPTDAMWQGNP